MERGTSGAGATGECLVVRYAEIGLKGGNRRYFEERLQRNIRDALASTAPARVGRAWGRLLVFPEGDPAPALARLGEVFGVASVSPAVGTEKDLAEMEAVAERLVGAALARRTAAEPVPFRVEAHRGDKRFPMNSVEVNRRLGASLLAKFPRLKVDLDHATLTLGVDVRDEAAYLYVDRLEGPGGLPVGASGRVLSLISGGIDSPVAAWLAMKRGCRVHFVTFHSYPFIGEATKEKVKDVVRRLSRYQGPTLLLVAPFAAIQTEIRKGCPEPYRTVLYRRMMNRVAVRLARRHRCLALVTGDSIGQVASQTLENLRCAEDASDLPVLRPLLSYDKRETIALAERIGTFGISIRPAEDCCTLFQPDHPVIRGDPEVCRQVETEIDFERLVEDAAASCEAVRLAEGKPDRVLAPGAIVPSPPTPDPENPASRAAAGSARPLAPEDLV
ncbi:MAG TPA: tRNA uracil 4-sulfurtransferase ThiI [Planctomycetota bacterium]|jgi:thiamine biosynthesis protein ThiI|nr:tRNA uracil 4-sulfurtransferase ThiI [Planctomycetota bacterium]